LPASTMKRLRMSGCMHSSRDISAPGGFVDCCR
jgi:hypothetical protein